MQIFYQFCDKKIQKNAHIRKYVRFSIDKCSILIALLRICSEHRGFRHKGPGY